MTTATDTIGPSKPAKKSRARKAKPAPPDTCRLTLHIRGIAYAARPFPTEDGRAVILRKSGSTEPHTVAETPHGPTCDCGDFIFRRDGTDPRGCKHVRALVALGLIARTTEAVAGYPADSWPALTDGHRYSASR